MKLDEALAIIERFFLDVIGTIFAGALFLFLVVYFFNLPIDPSWLDKAGTGKTILMLGASYAAGHFLTYLGGAVVEPLFRLAVGLIYTDFRRPAEQAGEKAKTEMDVVTQKLATEYNRVLDGMFWWTDRTKRDEGMSLNGVAATQLQVALREGGYLRGEEKLRSYNELRNLALSVEGVDKALVYRFQFLGLFNLTTATAVAAAITIWCGYHLLHLVWPELWSLLTSPYSIQPRSFAWFYVPTAIIFAGALLERSARFYGISMRVPLSEALIRLRTKAAVPRTTSSQPFCDKPGKLPRVYLAGGFKSGWQNRIIAEFAGQLECVDPSKHGINATKNYTTWDLCALNSCDLVFAYLEDTNPGGYALALEVGYAKGQGKTIIYVEEPGNMSVDRTKYLGMLQASANYTCASLDEGLKILRELLAQKLA